MNEQMEKTEKIKRQVPLLGKLAVKFNFITKEQLKQSLQVFRKSEEEGNFVTLSEIFIGTEVILPEDMEKLHEIKADYEAKQGVEKLGKEEIVFKISGDKLRAAVIIPENFKENLTPEIVFEKLKENGVKFGIVKEYEIVNYINNKSEYGKPKLIARGTPVFKGHPPAVEFFFNSNYCRDESFEIDSKFSKKTEKIKEVEEGDLLVEKTSMIPPDTGTDVFGKSIEVDLFDDIILRIGSGSELFEEELKIIAVNSGIPFLSVDGRVSVFQTIEISGDYGVASGSVEKDSSLVVNGIITGEFRVRGGSITATEIRDANIDVLGDVNVEIGITGSVIKCQGDLSAKYIHGSVIETYGSVISENEILDSTITTSGICISEKSKIIGSVIAANRGVKAVGIGTKTSVPCEITIGSDINSQNNIQRTGSEIQKNIELLSELKDKETLLKDEQNKVNQNLISKIDLHKQINNAIVATDKNIGVLESKELHSEVEKSKKTLSALEEKKRVVALYIREKSDRIQELGDLITKIPDEISLVKKENRELELDNNFISEWRKTNKPISILKVKGELASGTIITGVNSFKEMDKVKNVTITEKKVPGSEPHEWEIKTL